MTLFDVLLGFFVFIACFFFACRVIAHYSERRFTVDNNSFFAWRKDDDK